MIDANGNMYYYTYDGLGSVTALWHNGTVKTVVERYSYTPFGQTTVCDAAGNPKTSNISDFGNRFMFTGREYDDETNLYYYRARMYSPALCRFMQPDPIGYADSMNLYQYCGNNPINFIDPWGLKSKEAGFWGDFGNALLGEAGPIAGALMRGGVQMAANAIQGLQDTAIGLVNIALIGSWMMCEQAGSDDPQGYLDIIFPSPQWARGMVCEQSDIEYEGSKMASTLLIGWGVSKLGGATTARYGSKGLPDHQAKVAELRSRAQGELRVGERILQEQKVRGINGLNRNPDIQILDSTGKTRKVFEAERHPTYKRNRLREQEYRKYGVDYETHPVK